MWIKDWWDRMRRMFKKEDTVHETETVMELKSDQAPEPVPDRKTSDEMIEEIAESTLHRERRTAEETDDAAGQDAQLIPPAMPEPEEQPEAPKGEETDLPYEVGEPDERDPSEEVTWCEAEEEDENKDCDQE